MDDLVRQRVDEILREKIAMGAGVPVGGVKAGVKAGVVTGGARKKKYPKLRIYAKNEHIGTITAQTKKEREAEILALVNKHHISLKHGRFQNETAAEFNERARAFAERKGTTIKYAKCHLGAKIKACEEHRAARNTHEPPRAEAPKKKRYAPGPDSIAARAREYADEHGVTLAVAKCKVGSESAYCTRRSEAKYKNKALPWINARIKELAPQHPKMMYKELKEKATNDYYMMKADKAMSKGEGDMGYGYGHDLAYRQPNREMTIY